MIENASSPREGPAQLGTIFQVNSTGPANSNATTYTWVGHRTMKHWEMSLFVSCASLLSRRVTFFFPGGGDVDAGGDLGKFPNSQWIHDP